MAARPELIALCVIHVLLNTSGPILLTWVKVRHGGVYPFSSAALTFHGYSAAVLLGLGWLATIGPGGLRALWQPAMLVRCAVLAMLFTASDTFSIMSMQHLDPGTFSLVGKGLSMVFTVVLSRMIIGRRQTRLQHALIALILFFTIGFCRAETHARSKVSGSLAGLVAVDPGLWAKALVWRVAAVLLCTSGSVLQERLLAGRTSAPYLLQQTWMGCGALVATFFSCRFVDGLPLSRLFEGFDDWVVVLVLVMYTLNGLTAGLLVKRLGALAKALCVPVHLGGCYIYAVASGNATLEPVAVATWLASTFFVVAFAVSKAVEGSSLAWQAANAQPPK